MANNGQVAGQTEGAGAVAHRALDPVEARIDGRKWRVIPTRDMRSIFDQDGHCEEPWRARKAIRFDPDIPEGDILETLIHESLHAGIWQLDDDFVTTMARDIRRLVEIYFKVELRGCDSCESE